jgi:hypothetical protein
MIRAMQLRRMLAVAFFSIATVLTFAPSGAADCSGSAIARIAAGDDYDTPFVDFRNPRHVNAQELRELAKGQSGDARVEMMRIKPVETTPFAIDGYLGSVSPMGYDYHADVAYQLTVTAVGGSVLAELPVADCTHGEVKTLVTAARAKLQQAFVDNKGMLGQQKVRIVGLAFYGTRALMIAPAVDIIFDPPDFDMAFKRLPAPASSSLQSESSRPGGNAAMRPGGTKHKSVETPPPAPSHKSRPALFFLVLLIVAGVAWALTRR